MVFVDNEGAINLATNPFCSARTKHLDVRFPFVRELVSFGTIAVEHVLTTEQRADIVTKALAGHLHGAYGFHHELFSLILFWIEGVISAE